MDKKFCRVDKFLRIAVGVEVAHKSITRHQAVVVIPKAPGVVEVREYPRRDAIKAYLELNHNGDASPVTIQVKVPEVIKEAPWGEIMFNTNPAGAKVLFGRAEEEKPFGLDPGKYYLTLRLWRGHEHPFNPLYVRVDHGDLTYFFALKAKWEDGVISIDIERDPSDVPHFLT